MGSRGIRRSIATNLLTMHQSDILRVLGSLSAATMAQIDDCLKVNIVEIVVTQWAASR